MNYAEIASVAMSLSNAAAFIDIACQSDPSQIPLEVNRSYGEAAIQLLRLLAEHADSIEEAADRIEDRYLFICPECRVPIEDLNAACQTNKGAWFHCSCWCNT
jgi:hypothetical protein